jgi:hypothetical protein
MQRRRDPVPRGIVRVCFHPEACVWSWELVDRTTGALIESGWQAGWLAYDTSDEAHAAGTERLRRLELHRAA